MWSYSEMFSTFGDVAYADRVERIAFNALQAAWGGPGPGVGGGGGDDGGGDGAAAGSDMIAHQVR